MGIYIKGMDLPDCCDKCPFKKYIGSDRLVCGITGYRFYAFDVGWGDKPYVRHESCPLAEIPPHGRLIDADAFCAKILEIVKRQKYDDFYAKSLSVGAILREVVRELRGEGFDGFDNAPTIIPAEPCNDLAKPNNNIFVVQNIDEDEGLFAAKPIDYMHTPSVEEIIKGDGE